MLSSATGQWIPQRMFDIQQPNAVVHWYITVHDDSSDFELKKAHHTSPAGELWCVYCKYSRRLTARYWDRPVFSSQTKANSMFWVHQNRLVQMPSTYSIISVFFRWNALWKTLTIIIDLSAHFDYKDTIVMIYIYIQYFNRNSLLRNSTWP